MTTIFFIIIITILISGLIYCIYMLERNRKVGAFRNKVNNLAYEYSIRHLGENKDGWDLSYNKLPSHDDMLHSFKSLKLESYFDKNTINELLS